MERNDPSVPFKTLEKRSRMAEWNTFAISKHLFWAHCYGPYIWLEWFDSTFWSFTTHLGSKRHQHGAKSPIWSFENNQNSVLWTCKVYTMQHNDDKRCVGAQWVSILWGFFWKRDQCVRFWGRYPPLADKNGAEKSHSWQSRTNFLVQKVETEPNSYHHSLWLVWSLNIEVEGKLPSISACRFIGKEDWAREFVAKGVLFDLSRAQNNVIFLHQYERDNPCGAMKR